MYFIIILIIIILISIYICSCVLKKKDNFKNKLLSFNNKKYRYAVIYSKKRLNNVIKLENDLNIKLEKWPAVFTESCPKNKNYSLYAKKFCTTCRGLSIAHKEIWEDFISSDSEFILIFEDDAELESLSKLNFIYEKLNNINADITYLGHCYGHLCLHAYVLTKEGAKILIENIKTCGAAIDEQISLLINDNIIEAEFVKNPNEKKHWTQGLFHQIGINDGDGSMQQYKDYEKNKIK